MEGKGEGGLQPQERRNFRKRFPLFFVDHRRNSNCEKYVRSKNRNIDILLFFFSGFSKFSFGCLGIFVRKYILDARILQFYYNCFSRLSPIFLSIHESGSDFRRAILPIHRRRTFSIVVLRIKIPHFESLLRLFARFSVRYSVFSQ